MGEIRQRRAGCHADAHVDVVSHRDETVRSALALGTRGRIDVDCTTNSLRYRSPDEATLSGTKTSSGHQRHKNGIGCATIDNGYSAPSRSRIRDRRKQYCAILVMEEIEDKPARTELYVRRRRRPNGAAVESESRKYHSRPLLTNSVVHAFERHWTSDL